MTHNATIGESVRLSDLSKLAGHIKITLNWRLLPDLKNPPEGDMFCFMRDKSGQTPTNEDFVFFNNMQSGAETVVLTPPLITDLQTVEGNQSLIVHLQDIRYEIVEILIGFNLYRADERDQSFRFLQHLSLNVCLEDNTPLLHYECMLEPHKTSPCLSMLSLKRDGGEWNAEILDQTYPSFNDIARENGIVAAGG